MAKFKMPLKRFEAEHAAMGELLKEARANRNNRKEGETYTVPLRRLADSHARLGAMLDETYASITTSEPTSNANADAANAAVDTMGPRGLDSAIPDLHRLAPGVSALGENMDRLLRNR